MNLYYVNKFVPNHSHCNGNRPLGRLRLEEFINIMRVKNYAKIRNTKYYWRRH